MPPVAQSAFFFLLTHSAFPCLLLVLGARQRRFQRRGLLYPLVEFAGLELLSLGLPALTWLVLGSGYALLFALDHAFHARLGWSLDADVLRFARREPENARVLLRQGVTVRSGVVIAVALAANALVLLGPAVAMPSVLAWVGGAVCLGLMALATTRRGPLPPVLNFIRACWQSRRAPAKAMGLTKPERESLPAGLSLQAPDPSRPNVLLIVCESLCKRVLDSAAGQAAAPRYHAFLQQERDAGRLAGFPHALANSTSSDVAYSSLFTGLSPDQPWERFHRNPLLWDVAKARGYATSLYTSQSLSWCHLGDFLLGPSLDRAVYREALGEPAANDLAMDDRVLNRYITTELPLAGVPFFSVVNHNMLHAPFSVSADGKASGGSSALEDYLRALRLFDTCFGEILDSLAASGQLDRTVIAFTADHGETPEHHDNRRARRMPLRLDQFDVDGLSVPLWLRWPLDGLAETQAQRLHANTALTVSNTDLYPTLLQLFGVDADTRQRLASGQSLLEPVSAGRTLAMYNTGAFRQWACEPFALAREHWLLMFHDLQRRFELLDLRRLDAGDHWHALSPSAQAVWLAEVAGHPLATDILARRRLITPPHSSSAVAQEYDLIAAQRPGAELHKLNNWGLFSLDEWQALCRNCARFIELQPGDRVFEAGCGSGAFLEVMQQQGAAATDGIDISSALVEVARARLSGTFRVGDIQDLSHVASGSYDKVVSNGVFLYLPSHASCERSALEMIRIARPGGLIYIGLLNDPERLASYHSVHRPSGNAFVRRDFWHDLGARLGLAVETVDQEQIYSKSEGYDGHARLRYSVRMRKPAQPLAA